ncbi:hypothetical protein [Fontibacillus sp. BL9]|uniref:hypothetical protein n=1 Tax=Fontibacillus sp. BL9 TaxID=3389971 RepID=UPI00397C3730
MAVSISQEGHVTIVNYAEGKRPLKVAPYIARNAADRGILWEILTFVERESNEPHHLAKMEDAKFYALVERLATLACRKFSPMTKWGVTKPEIRGIVLFTLRAAVAAGTWPESYEVTRTTFVRNGGYAGE